MLASSIVNYGIPAALVLTLVLSFFFYRRVSSRATDSSSAQDAAVAALADPSLVASSNVPDSATPHAAGESLTSSAGGTVDEDSLELAKRVESIGGAEAEGVEEEGGGTEVSRVGAERRL